MTCRFPVPAGMSEPFSRLMIAQPQLAAFILDANLTIYEDKNTTTAETNSVWIRVNPEFIRACHGGSEGPEGADIFVLAHEAYHAMVMHPQWLTAMHNAGGVPIGPRMLARIKSWNPDTKWREAMQIPLAQVSIPMQFALDYIVNDALITFGMSIRPNTLLHEPAFINYLDSEDDALGAMLGRYRIEPEFVSDKFCPTSGGMPCSGGGDVQSCPSQAELDATPAPDRRDTPQAPDQLQRRQLVRQALEDIARNVAGVAAGNIQGLLERLVPSKVRWRNYIRQDIKVAGGRGALSWSRIKPRALAMGTVLPGHRSRSSGFVAVVRDTSGSVSLSEQEVFGACIVEICKQVFPKRLILLDVDSAVEQVQEADSIGSLREAFANRAARTVRGGGGTDMRVGFDWCSEQKLVPDTLIVLTDGQLYRGFPKTHAPAKRALWVITRPGVVVPPEAGRSCYMPVDHV